MFLTIIKLYKKSKPATQPYKADGQTTHCYLTKIQWSSFMAGTIGYSLYYVCRTGLNVVEKPIIGSGLLDAQHEGIIGSTLLFALFSPSLLSRIGHCELRHLLRLSQSHMEG